MDLLIFKFTNLRLVINVHLRTRREPNRTEDSAQRTEPQPNFYFSVAGKNPNRTNRDINWQNLNRTELKQWGFFLGIPILDPGPFSQSQIPGLAML